MLLENDSQLACRQWLFSFFVTLRCATPGQWTGEVQVQVQVQVDGERGGAFIFLYFPLFLRRGPMCSVYEGILEGWIKLDFGQDMPVRGKT